LIVIIIEEERRELKVELTTPLEVIGGDRGDFLRGEDAFILYVDGLRRCRGERGEVSVDDFFDARRRVRFGDDIGSGVEDCTRSSFVSLVVDFLVGIENG